MSAASFSEVFSIGAVLPFLAVLTNPQGFMDNPNFQTINEWFNVRNSNELLLGLTLVFCLAVLFSGVSRIALLWATTRLSFAVGADLSIEMYRKCLYQPYSVHLSRNSSEVIAAVTTKANHVVNRVISPLLTAISSFVMSFVVVITLFLLDVRLAVSIFFGFGFVYLLIFKLTRGRLKRNDVKISKETNRALRALQEGLGGIRDVLLDGTQELFCNVYRKSDRVLRTALGENELIGTVPRFAIEGLGIILVALLAYSFVNRTDGADLAVPVLGAMALGIQRLLPMIQQFYYSCASVYGNQKTLSDTLNLLDQPLPVAKSALSNTPVLFENNIRLHNVSFGYAKGDKFVLNNINLAIQKGSTVGFIGETGSGKSTLVDILMGLLSPSSGHVVVDDIDITIENLLSWQSHIAHVPQHVYLADASFMENIAFGIPPEEIDLQRVRNAAERAKVAHIIEASSNGYNTQVGEGGMKLSGGERQRLGIARALYKKADIFILDEATSALDVKTENLVMDSVRSLGKNFTVLIIAHRLITLKDCDKIYRVEASRLTEVQSYEQLLMSKQ